MNLNKLCAVNSNRQVNKQASKQKFSKIYGEKSHTEYGHLFSKFRARQFQVHIDFRCNKNKTTTTTKIEGKNLLLK